MKILITGGNGQLGTDCLDILGVSHECKSTDYQELDITNQNQVTSYLTATNPEVVINCAAYTAVDRCENDEAKCRAINAQGPANLATACNSVGARFIHISTDYVFDGKKPAPQYYQEQDPVHPLSVYGATKLQGELAAQHAENHLILRPAWLYGIGGANFLKTMLRLAVADPTRTIRVVDDQFGSLTWSYSLARQIAVVLDNDLQGIAHATAEGYSNWYQAAKYFLQRMGVNHTIEPCTTSEYPTPAHRPGNSILENTRLKQAGKNVMRDWKEDVDLFIEKFREQLLTEAVAAAGKQAIP
ncbi:MAG: dTDP-4-dehydrorhamnose reductase [Desulfobulbus propionicus]|nr:MAG: dTDP-4-dehydrorhamnose reductase [Desulfobulbus propionicus]